MIIKPMVRSNICINAHPIGCKKAVDMQIEYAVAQKIKRQKINNVNTAKKMPKNVLVLGCSNGYGLASRITAAFGYGAATLGVSFEKEATEKKGGTPGWYNNIAFEQAAAKDNLLAVTINGDAYSDEVKQNVVNTAKKHGLVFDLVVYSLASPVRTDPKTGVMYKSVIKPIGKPYSGVSVDVLTAEMKETTAEPATDDEVAQTVKVMGGEDWALWIEKLQNENLLANGCVTIAYSYIGPHIAQAIYRKGSIGMAKEHLEHTAHELSKIMSAYGGKAYVSVNKGLVTRSSAVIPIIPLYLAVLFKIMKQHNVHEGCIEQIERLFAERLYTLDANIPTDEENRIRIDDWEMDEKIQSEVNELMKKVTQENITQLTDLAGYKHDFLAASGFDVAGVDYDCELDRMDAIN